MCIIKVNECHPDILMLLPGPSCLGRRKDKVWGGSCLGAGVPPEKDTQRRGGWGTILGPLPTPSQPLAPSEEILEAAADTFGGLPCVS